MEKNGGNQVILTTTRLKEFLDVLNEYGVTEFSCNDFTVRLPGKQDRLPDVKEKATIPTKRGRDGLLPSEQEELYGRVIDGVP